MWSYLWKWLIRYMCVVGVCCDIGDALCGAILWWHFASRFKLVIEKFCICIHHIKCLRICIIMSKLPFLSITLQLAVSMNLGQRWQCILICFCIFFFAFLVANEQAFDNTLPCHEQRLQYIVMSCPSQYVLKLYYMFINFNIICIHCNQVSRQIVLS